MMKGLTANLMRLLPAFAVLALTGCIVLAEAAEALLPASFPAVALQPDDDELTFADLPPEAGAGAAEEAPPRRLTAREGMILYSARPAVNDVMASLALR